MNTTLTFRQVVVIALVPSFIDSVGSGAVVPLVALQARELGASVSFAAAVVALMGVGQLISSLPTAALVARIGERNALVGAGFGQVLAFLVAGLTQSLWWYAAAFVALGASWSIWLQARQGFLIIAVPSEDRARIMSTLGGVARAGLLIGPIIGAVIITQWSQGAVFVFAAACSLVAAVLVLRTPDLDATAREQAAHDGHRSVLSVVREHRRVLATVGTSAALVSAARAIRLTALPLWCEHVGITAAQTSLIFGIAAILDLSLAYSAGTLMDRHGRAIACVLVIGSAGVGLLGLPFTHTFTAVLLLNLVMALGNGFGSGIYLTLGADTAPEVGRAQYLGGWRLCGDLGNSASPTLFGLLAGVFPLGVAVGLAGAGLVGGTAWAWHWVHQHDKTRLHAP